MATPTLRKHVLPGVLGDLLVDVRTSSALDGGPAIVIAHGFKGFKDWGMFPVFADRVARAGYSAVSYNASGSGVDESGECVWPERFFGDTFTNSLADLDTVCDGLHQGQLLPTPPSSLGLVGHSRGGGIALLAASRRRDARALVTWSAISTLNRWPESTRREWLDRGYLEVTNSRTGQVLRCSAELLHDLDTHREEYDLETCARKLPIPWLIVHGEEDETVPLLEGRLLATACPSAETCFVPGTGHTYGASHPLQGRPDPMIEVFDRSLDFLARHLG
jgi:pimeloyl-ACP methyl ester carboxylesterase